MARAERIDADKAIGIFESIVTHRHIRLSTHSPDLVERDVREMFLKAAPGPVGPSEFIHAWMAWQADRKGFGYTVLDVTKPCLAADFALAGIVCGLVSTVGVGSERTFRQTSPDVLLYERGRLRLPERKPGSPRISIERRHAMAARPIIADLLRRIADHPAAGTIPAQWFCEIHYLPEAVANRTFLQARDILEGLHEDLLVWHQLEWMRVLRCHLMALGDPPPPEVPADDVDALMAVA